VQRAGQNPSAPRDDQVKSSVPSQKVKSMRFRKSSRLCVAFWFVVCKCGCQPRRAATQGGMGTRPVGKHAPASLALSALKYITLASYLVLHLGCTASVCRWQAVHRTKLPCTPRSTTHSIKQTTPTHESMPVLTLAAISPCACAQTQHRRPSILAGHSSRMTTAADHCTSKRMK
jgi:hypothetical protein